MSSPRRWLALVLCVGAVVGCDTLQARRRASDAAAEYKKGQLRKAAEVYEESAKLDGQIPEVQLNLGFTYLSMMDAEPAKSTERLTFGDKAIAAFKRYIELRPEDPRGRNYLVQTFVDGKRYDEARAYFGPELDKEPPSLEVISIMSEIAAKLGKVDDALGFAERRAKLKPDDPDTHLAVGVLIWDHLHRHPDIVDTARLELCDRGIQSLQRAAALRPKAPEPLTYLNLVYRERVRGHPCEQFDAGYPDAEPRGAKRRVTDVPDASLPDVGTADECMAAQADDNKRAQEFYTQALELMKAQREAKADGGPGGVADGGTSAATQGGGAPGLTGSTGSTGGK